MLEETLKAHKPNLDTTGLENSFDQFGRTIFEVLSAQQRTNQKLEEQFCRARPLEVMQVQEIEEVDEIGTMQRRLRDVVCRGCGEKGHLQRDCPHRTADMQDDGFDDSNAYAGKSEQVIRITQPIKVATRDNIYINIWQPKELGPTFTKRVIEGLKRPYKSNKRSMQP